jgi:hypothetical protein
VEERRFSAASNGPQTIWAFKPRQPQDSYQGIASAMPPAAPKTITRGAGFALLSRFGTTSGTTDSEYLPLADSSLDHGETNNRSVPWLWNGHFEQVSGR